VTGEARLIGLQSAFGARRFFLINVAYTIAEEISSKDLRQIHFTCSTLVAAGQPSCSSAFCINRLIDDASHCHDVSRHWSVGALRYNDVSRRPEPGESNASYYTRTGFAGSMKDAVLNFRSIREPRTRSVNVPTNDVTRAGGGILVVYSW
jgi:hypothetical protein